MKGIPRLGILLLALAGCAASQDAPIPTKGALSFETPVSAGMSIVTEISPARPFVGQQISVVYKLRTFRSLAAVDIDPQQYPGFWTEGVALPEENRTAFRRVRGRNALEIVLRQVVAFPLRAGVLKLPPLALKIKREGRHDAAVEDWDLRPSTVPLVVQVRPLPEEGIGKAGMPLVGSLHGVVRPSRPGVYSEAVLELEGTANLAFFRVGDRLALPPGALVRPEGVDRTVRTVVIGGSRRISLVARRRWSIRSAEGRKLRIADVRVPVFSPDDETWKEAVIEGMKPESGADQAVPKGQPAKTGSGERAGSFPGWRWTYGAAAVFAAAALIAWLLRRRNRRPASAQWMDRSAVLMAKAVRKGASRPLLDQAHRILDRCAEEMSRGRRAESYRADLDRCRLRVEQLRFRGTSLSEIEREEIVKSVRNFLTKAAPEI